MTTTPPSSHRKLAMLLASVLLMVTGSVPAAVPQGGHVFLPSVKEAELYRLIRDHPDQQRAQVVLDPRLCQAARNHAEDTQRRRFFSHVNPDGVNANQRAINAGYPLPSHYQPSQNYIESMAGSGLDTPADAVANWRASAPHATHVFGKSSFYVGQVVLGVGHARASGLNYATYVFVSAPLPVGEKGAPTAAAASAATLDVDLQGNLFVTGAPPEAILEVWKSSSSLTSWTLDRTVTVDSTGRFPVGTKTGPAGFLRLGYFRP